MNWPRLALKNQPRQQVKPDDHSEVVPLLPIPNRTVKRLCADDSADSRVKVGHRQAITVENAPSVTGRFFLSVLFILAALLILFSSLILN